MIIEGITLKINYFVFNFGQFKENLYISIYEASIYFILIIGVMIHSEILILNCCGLNEYTIKNLKIKSEEDFKYANKKSSDTSFNNEDSRETKAIPENTELSIIIPTD